MAEEDAALDSMNVAATKMARLGENGQTRRLALFVRSMAKTSRLACAAMLLLERFSKGQEPNR